MRFDHYEVILQDDGQPMLLGRGGMGETYRARDTTLGREVALKIVHPHLLTNPEVRSRFLREARATARLHHRNIATVHHQGQTGDTCYYAMEFIPGVTLQQVLKDKGTLPVAAALALTRQVVQGLAEAEKHGLIHRDIKPANIMLVTEADGHELVKLIDFGLAKFAQGTSEEAEVTRQGSYLGTATTSSPEQCAGEDLDSRSDFYSLGVTLWHMVEGHPPFADANAMKVMMAHMREDLPFQRLRGLPKPLVKLLRRMLEKDRDKRPPNTAELMRLLDECASAIRLAGGEAAQARSPSRPAGGADQPTRMTVLSAGATQVAPAARAPRAALAGAVLLLVGGLAWWFGRDLLPQPKTEGVTPATPGVPTPPPRERTASEWRDLALAALAANDPPGFLHALADAARVLPSIEPEDAAALRSAFAAAYDTQGDPWREALAGSSPLHDLAVGLASNRLPELWLPLGEAAVASDRARAAGCLALASDPASGLGAPWLAAARLARAAVTRGLPEGPPALDAWAESLPALRSLPPEELRAWMDRRRLPLLETVAGYHLETLRFLSEGPPGVPPERAAHWRKESVLRAERAQEWSQAADLALALWKKSPATPEGEWALARLNQWLGQWLLSGAPPALGDAAAVEQRVDALAGDGIPAAMEWAGKRRLVSDPGAARGWFERAARAGSATAAAQYGLMVLNGAGGPADPALAGQWLRQSRDRGSEGGMLLLADALLEGALPEEAPGEAVATLRRAAHLGNGRAMDRLGDCYLQGRGVGEDATQALAWFENAIEAGHWQSLGNKGVLHMTGRGTPVDKALAVSLFQQGADKENPWCMFLLGRCLWAGEGVGADREKAMAWMRKSAAAGEADAAAFLREQ